MAKIRMADGSGEIDFRWIVEDVDRYGNVRIYVRRKNRPKVRLREAPSTDAFIAEYRAALAAPVPGVPAVAPGSFEHLCRGYYASKKFLALDESTKNWQRRALDRICEKRGGKPVALLTAKHVKRLRDELGDKPGAANARLKAMKALFAWAFEAEEVDRNPTLEVRRIAYHSDGFHAWTEEDLAAYEARHPLGSKARLAMTLLLWTAGRREDATRLGPQHCRGGRVRFTQAKNEHRKPVKVDLPLAPELAEAIEATPSGHMTFLVTEYGKPFSPAGFGNKMRQWCNEAGLPQCSAHGLRKAAATRLAEAGATAHEIMAVTGHKTLEEVERYTREAARPGLADSGLRKLKGEQKCPTSGSG
jgi:integrase/recombinase XerD